MAYNITLTDGTTFATIADGTVNTDSSVTLVGKNYAGYGQFLDENFIQMLENFSNTTAPTDPLTGQIWWDSGNFLLKVYNGTIWKTISAATSSATAPTSNVTGDLWYDTTNQQVKVWTGSAFLVVGPAYSSSTGQAGALPLVIVDVGSTSHTVTGLYVAGALMAVISDDAQFTPQSPTSTAFPIIYPGVTVSKSTSGQSGLLAGNVINNGNITFNAGGTPELMVLTATGANVGNAGVAGSGYVNALGNITGANIATGGILTATGNITGGNIATGGLATVTGNITGGNIATGGSITATGTGNITGNVNAGNLRTTGLITATGTVTGGNVASGGFITAGSTVSSVGNITSAANIAGGNIISSANVSAVGNISGSFFLGNGSQLTGLSAAFSVAKIENGTSNVAIAANGANITMTVSSTANVVVVAPTGITTSGTLTLNSGNALTAIVNGGGNGVGNIGSITNYFNQVFATSVQANYADVAERFEADEVLDPGTVVELGGAKEITRSRLELSENVFGVISTRPAFTMNGSAGENDTHPAVAMTGRVPVKVTGIINKGDRLVSAGDGLARAAGPGEATSFNIIGRALVAKSTHGVGTVEAIVSIQV